MQAWRGLQRGATVQRGIDSSHVAVAQLISAALGRGQPLPAGPNATYPCRLQRKYNSAATQYNNAVQHHAATFGQTLAACSTRRRTHALAAPNRQPDCAEVPLVDLALRQVRLPPDAISTVSYEKLSYGKLSYRHKP
jgi:hypothetical protein